MNKPEKALLQPGKNCWRVEDTDQFAFIVDASDYFINLRKAMLAARHSIMMIGWDFDTRISFGDSTDGGPQRLGDFLLWLADRTPSLEIRLLRWDTNSLKAMLRGNTLFTILRWKAHPRITLRLDKEHPLGSSHHQKIVAIDDCIAFCGGIDMTIGRWDTREHLDDNPRRIGPGGKPHGPWHDATSAFDGPAAKAIGELARGRWKTATKQTLPACPDGSNCWPDGLEPGFRKIRLGMARSIPKMEGVEPVHEIEAVYLDLIARAEKYIYAESQYFASHRIAHAIAKRLIEEDGPEIVIINPHTAEGWLEPIAMDTARARLVEALRKIDKYGRFRVYHPVTEGGEEIYVHAKVTVVDDKIMRVGSSNFNNRSLRLDTEYDVIICDDQPAHKDLENFRGSKKSENTLNDKISFIRNDLLAEHLGVTADEIATRLEKTGSLIAVIEALRGKGRSLVPYEIPELSGIKKWLADNEILDPEGPDDIFESPAKRGLFKGWGRKLRFGFSKKS